MNVPAYLRKTGLMLLAAAVWCCAMTACDGVIYDEEGDCSVTYRVVFRYDRNMLWTDAFAQKVGSVHLYAFDPNGVLVWERSERGETVVARGNSMLLELPAGDYTLVAWCGLQNDGERPESFSVSETRVGVTRIEELQCRLNRAYEADGTPYSKAKLYPLFHGTCEVSLPVNDDGGSYTYTMDLTKDTNHVRIILQQLSGEPVDENRFTFRIEEENGLMDWNNGLLTDEMISYREYDKRSGTAGLGIEDYPVLGGARPAAEASSRAIVSVGVAIADLSIARLTTGRRTWLTIRTVDDGQIAARIPLTDYALLLKDGYDKPMDDQEFLDRQDEYALTFFLDSGMRWTSAWVIINSWRVVRQDMDFE